MAAVVTSTLRCELPCPAFSWCVCFLGVCLAVKFLSLFRGVCLAVKFLSLFCGVSACFQKV